MTIEWYNLTVRSMQFGDRIGYTNWSARTAGCHIIDWCISDKGWHTGAWFYLRVLNIVSIASRDVKNKNNVWLLTRYPIVSSFYAHNTSIQHPVYAGMVSNGASRQSHKSVNRSVQGMLSVALYPMKLTYHHFHHEHCHFRETKLHFQTNPMDVVTRLKHSCDTLFLDPLRELAFNSAQYPLDRHSSQLAIGFLGAIGQPQLVKYIWIHLKFEPFKIPIGFSSWFL